MKEYKFNYELGHNVVFQVDEKVFTREVAREFLEFYSWSIPYDKDKPIEEALRKMAIDCVGKWDYSLEGIKSSVNENFEVYFEIDGSKGVLLTRCDTLSPEDFDFDVEILEL